MPKLTLVHLIFQGLPEIMAMVAVALTFANMKLNWRIMIAIGIIQGITTYLIRMLPMSFGIHTIISIITLAVYIKLVTKLTLITVLRVCAIAVILVAFVEFIVDFTIFGMLKITVEEAMDNTALWIALGWPQVIVLASVAWFKNRLRTDS